MSNHYPGRQFQVDGMGDPCHILSQLITHPEPNTTPLT